MSPNYRTRLYVRCSRSSPKKKKNPALLQKIHIDYLVDMLRAGSQRPITHLHAMKEAVSEVCLSGPPSLARHACMSLSSRDS